MMADEAKSSVLLLDPKFAFNVGGALRACANFGTGLLMWTGKRVPPPDAWPPGARLPREERIRAYKKVQLKHVKIEEILGPLDSTHFIPVAVELRDNAEDLTQFIHPKKAIYIFGPEDGSISKGVLTCCHRFVRIPSEGCLNLASAVSVVLYDRLAKQDSID